MGYGLGIRSNEARETNFEFGICNLECKRIQNRGIGDSWRRMETRRWEKGLGIRESMFGIRFSVIRIGGFGHTSPNAYLIINLMDV